MLTFREKFSYRLYQYVKRATENSVYIPMETLRNLLEIKESYKRYYDIEKNLLMPVLKDLEDNGHLPLLYTKNKNGDYKSAKILGITLEKQIVENSNTIIINDIMTKIGKEVKNFTEIYSIVLKALAEHGEEYVRNNTDYALKNFTGNFDIYLEQLLLKNTPVEKAFLTVKKKFKTLFELHMEVLKIAQKESHYPSNLKFLIKIYSLKDGESTVCDGKDISMKITYNKNDFSFSPSAYFFKYASALAQILLNTAMHIYFSSSVNPSKAFLANSFCAFIPSLIMDSALFNITISICFLFLVL